MRLRAAEDPRILASREIETQTCLYNNSDTCEVRGSHLCARVSWFIGLTLAHVTIRTMYTLAYYRFFVAWVTIV